MITISLSSTPQNTKSFHSIFQPKTSHTPRSSMKSPHSKDDIEFVSNCAKRVLSIFQNFKHHNELCEKCIRFVEQAIKILEETINLPNNQMIKLIESNEYNHFNNLIFDIEFYLRKYDPRTAVQSEVKESIQDFAFNLENCVNTFQQAYEAEKPKKPSAWNPSIISKVKTIGRLIAMTKVPIKGDDDDFTCEENPNRLIIQQELITSTGIRRGNNNVRKGNFISEEVAEKYVGRISKKSDEFSRFQSEVLYIKKLSRDCSNILSVNGYFERSGCLWIVEEWAEYNLLDYLKIMNLDWGVKLKIARGIANALNYIHSMNLLHHNVQSNSVLLNRDLEPKLHKFGKVANDCVFLKSVQSLTSSWSAPEVKRNEKCYTSESEVYCFGIILWEIASQDFQSKNEFVEPICIDGAPTNYLTLMEKALNKEPHNRPTMQEMFESLCQLESSYNTRYQKKLATRNVTNTNSVVSNSSNISQDFPTLIDESSASSTSCVTSRATSISTSDDENTKEIIEKALKHHKNNQYSKAFKLFNEYNRRHPSSDVAKYWIGLYYYKGYQKSQVSPKQSIKLSLKYFGEAAKLNHPEAQYYYSRILLNNYIPSTDFEENRFQVALEFLKKASDQNHPASMRWLGNIMRKGEFGCKKDIEASKILTDRSKRLSKNVTESRNTTASRKSRTLSNVSTTSNASIVSFKGIDQRKSRTLSNVSNASTGSFKGIDQRKSRTSSNVSNASTGSFKGIDQRKSRTLSNVSNASTGSFKLGIEKRKSRTLLIVSDASTGSFKGIDQMKSKTSSNVGNASIVSFKGTDQRKRRTSSNVSTTLKASTASNVNQGKSRTSSNVSTMSRPIATSKSVSNQASKRNSTVYIVKTTKNNFTGTARY